MVLTWVAYIVKSAMFMFALRIAANISCTVILDIPVLALAIADCQSSIIQSTAGVTVSRCPTPWSHEPRRINHIYLTAEVMRVNTRARRMVVGDFGRGND